MKCVVKSALVMVLLFAATAWAQPILPTLPAGTPYRLAFVTSTQRDASTGFINEYNLFVNNVASTQPALAGLSWTAIASTSTVDAINNTGTNGPGVPIYLLDGSTKIADDYFDLWDGTLDQPLDITEMGTAFISATAGSVWTGTDTNGLGLPSVELGSPVPRIGDLSMSNSDWISHANRNSGEFYSLYAISNELIATAVPEPSAFLCIGLVGVSIAGLRRFRTWSSSAADASVSDR